MGLRKPKRWLRCPMVGGLLLGSDDGRIYGPRTGEDWALKPPEAKGARVAWHEVKAATIYRVDQVAQKESGRRQILQKFWVLSPTQTRRQNLARRPCRGDPPRHGQSQVRLCPGGRAVWIWNIIEDRFITSLKGLDFYHASTHLWAIAHELFPEEAQAKAWVEPLLHQLKHGKKPTCSTRWKSCRATPGRRSSFSHLLQREITYFQTHREHLHYQGLAAKGSPIGRRYGIHLRPAPDSRQTHRPVLEPDRLAHMLALKAALQNDDWYALCLAISSADSELLPECQRSLRQLPSCSPKHLR